MFHTNKKEREMTFIRQRKNLNNLREEVRLDQIEMTKSSILKQREVIRVLKSQGSKLVKLEDWMNTNGVKMMILNGIIRKMNCKMNLIQNQREQHNSKEAKSMKKAKEII